MRKSRETVIEELGDALSELLQELFVQRVARWDRENLEDVPRGLRLLDFAEMAMTEPPSEVEIFISRLTKPNLIEGALKVSIIQIGCHLNELGGLDLMQDVADKACQKPLRVYGHTELGSSFQEQMSVVDKAWHGIGNWYS